MKRSIFKKNCGKDWKVWYSDFSRNTYLKKKSNKKNRKINKKMLDK